MWRLGYERSEMCILSGRFPSQRAHVLLILVVIVIAPDPRAVPYKARKVMLGSTESPVDKGGAYKLAIGLWQHRDSNV